MEQRPLAEAFVFATSRCRCGVVIGPRSIRERAVQALRHEGEIADRVNAKVTSIARLRVVQDSVLPVRPPAAWHDVLDVELRWQTHVLVALGPEMQFDTGENRPKPLLLDVSVYLYLG